MNPDASTRALASIEVDVSSIEEGQAITVKWRGKPVFIRNRTAKEIEEAQGGSARRSEGSERGKRQSRAPAHLQPTTNRSAGEGKENWIVMIGSCTHLGCVPVGTAGDFGGWFCPCHGSHYDTAGRIRKGPAPRNLDIPVFAFTSDTTITNRLRPRRARNMSAGHSTYTPKIGLREVARRAAAAAAAGL